MKNKNAIIGIIIAVLVLVAVGVVLLLGGSSGSSAKGSSKGTEGNGVDVTYTGNVEVEKSNKGIVTEQSHNNKTEAKFKLSGSLKEGDSVTFTYDIVNNSKSVTAHVEAPEIVTDANEDCFTMISSSKDEKLVPGAKSKQYVVVQVTNTPTDNKPVEVTLNLFADAMEG